MESWTTVVLCPFYHLKKFINLTCFGYFRYQLHFKAQNLLIHSGKLLSTERRGEHETQTKMYNAIQISNLETLMKVSLCREKALGHYTENHDMWLSQNALQIRLIILPSTKMAQELISIIIKYLFPSPVKKKKVPYT